MEEPKQFQQFGQKVPYSTKKTFNLLRKRYAIGASDFLCVMVNAFAEMSPDAVYEWVKRYTGGTKKK